MTGWLIMYQNQLKMQGKFLRAENGLVGLTDGIKKTLKGDVENHKQTRDNTDLTPYKNKGGDYNRMDMPFNSLMTDFFENSDINDLIKHMLAHIKMETENPRMPESGFSLDKIMHLYVIFHRLALTQGSSYIVLPK